MTTGSPRPQTTQTSQILLKEKKTKSESGHRILEGLSWLGRGIGMGKRDIFLIAKERGREKKAGKRGSDRITFARSFKVLLLRRRAGR